MYAEHYYRLYHLNLHRNPIDYLENLVYLEQALKAPFCNPINAIGKVENEDEYNYYRYLFKMHCNILMVDTYRYLGGEFDRQKVYWFNAPFREIILDGLQKAKAYYECAKVYWNEAQRYSKLASKYQFLEIENLQYWMDECWEIENRELDYGKYIQKDLDKIASMEKFLNELDDSSFPIFGRARELTKFFDYRTIEQIRHDNDTKPLPPRKSGKIPTKKE